MSLTDKEILKALEICTQQVGCNGCPFLNSLENKYRGGYACAEEMRKSALDLIKRLQDEKKALINGQETLHKTIVEQKAEIERLEAEKRKLKTEMSYMSSPNTIGDRHEMGCW